ncbi:uncharacterized protein LOC107483870 [Arachis duranensis]|uniref:Uncharacterized protein LOC107483870 n=1 Tax=Arachis duranensis TaxID=130453 RepID=A0A6P4D1Q5_ARADU|nr:uncharacterized protein LOC107483870 [Arachis duranensis]
MPKKLRYNIIREPPKDVGTNAETEETTVGSITRGAQTSHEQPRDRAPPISSSANGALIVILFPTHFLEDGVRKVSRLSVKEAIALPSNTKIVLPFNKELQPIGQAARIFNGFLGSLGVDYSKFPIYAESWKHVNKAKKEHAYDMIKRVFHYEDDVGGKIKREIIKRIGKNWKDTRNNLYHKCYKKIRTYEKNLKHRSKGIEENEWKKFFDYHQKEETKDAIVNVERQDESSKHLSQNDSLAQVLRKEHLGRVRALGAGPCPTQVFDNAAGQPPGSVEPNEEYERRIAKLAAKLEEEQAKRQSIHKVLGYLVQQQGGNLPAKVVVELAFLGNTPD